MTDFRLEEPDRAWLDSQLAAIGSGPEKLIPLLQAVQRRFRWLPGPALSYLCDNSDITPSALTGVSSFYSSFRHRPAGTYTVKVCIGTACHVKGAGGIYDSLIRHLGCPPGEDTDADGTFTVEKVACLGCCTLAPAVQIGSVTYGHLTPAGAPSILDDFLRRQNAAAQSGVCTPGSAARQLPGPRIRLSLGSCCVANGTAAVGAAVRDTLRELGADVPITSVGCLGVCHQAPVLEIISANNVSAWYSHVQPEQVRPILRRHIPARGALRRVSAWVTDCADSLLGSQAAPGETSAGQLGDCSEQPVLRYLEGQRHIATEHCGTVDPLDIDDYIAHDGFAALRACVEFRSPADIIDEISRSGLRGRGGGGYPTGQKWKQVGSAAREHGNAFIICNGDEGDPGAFMDRKLLESYPYRIIEGMAIAAFAVGANRGFLYIRSEYPLAIERMREALERCRRGGWLGECAAGSSSNFTLDVIEGAGAFVCGEETALMQSIEGKRGMPRPRPPYPSQRGLWGAPTLINNCETFACIPWIIRNGAGNFSSIGTADSAGTKVFSLAGKIRYGGLIEVPMGSSIRDIVERIGGGIANGRSFKAVQVGGPSGGCIPSSMADEPLDYEALSRAGSMMGSGGLVVLDDRDCMVDIARYFLAFTQEQSCGRCTACRVGTRRMLDILEALCEGRADSAQLDTLESLAHTVQDASICGLGSSAPNPVLTTLRYFKSEYEAHVRGECPSLSCKALISYRITEKCDGCTRCAQQCPTTAIAFAPYQRHRIDQTACIRCDTCRQVCPVDAVQVVSPRGGEET